MNHLNCIFSHRFSFSQIPGAALVTCNGWTPPPTAALWLGFPTFVDAHASSLLVFARNVIENIQNVTERRTVADSSS